MNKLISAALLSGVLCLAAKADLVMYEFEGQVTSALYTNIAIGTSVHYTFGVDIDAMGFIDMIDPNRLDVYEPDYNAGAYFADYFYSDFIGDLVLPINDQIPVMEFHDARSVTSNYQPDQVYFVGGTNTNYVQVCRSGASSINDLQIGDEVYGYEDSYFTSSTGLYPAVSSYLTLVSITHADVPEPGILSLLATGLFGIGSLSFIRRRKQVV